MISKEWVLICLLIPFFSNAQEEKKNDGAEKISQIDSTFISDKKINKHPEKKLLKAEKKALRKSAKKLSKNTNSLKSRISKNKKKISDSLEIQIDRYVSPTKATFFSLLLPGLGQAYNKKYWKIPIVYLALYGAISNFSKYDGTYESYRSAYARRLAGFTDDPFYDVNESGIVVGNPDVPTETLLAAQSNVKETRDLFLVLSIIAYMLNVVDASVDAHMKYYNIDYDLSLKPFLNGLNSNRYTLNIPHQVGVSLNINF